MALTRQQHGIAGPGPADDLADRLAAVGDAIPVGLIDQVVEVAAPVDALVSLVPEPPLAETIQRSPAYVKTTRLSWISGYRIVPASWAASGRARSNVSRAA